MAKKQANQPELLTEEAPAIVTPADPGQPAEKLELVDDKPDVVRMDLRKFNKTRAKVNEAVAAITGIDIINSQEGVNKMMVVLKDADGVKKVIEAKRKELGDPYRLEVDRINTYAKGLVGPIDSAITSGKKKILDFHTAEAARVKKERTEAREMLLHQLDLVLVQKSDTILIPHYVDKLSDAIIYRRDLEDAEPAIWMDILERHTQARRDAADKKILDLQAEKEGSDFFGDSEASAAIQEKIDQVVAAPATAKPVMSGNYASVKTTGLTKTWTHELIDISQVPREYLQLDEQAIRKAIAAGTREIAGIKIYQKESISLR